MNTKRLPGRRRRGQILVLNSLMLAVLLGFLGIAIDLGFLHLRRRQIQTAADAAAMAAVQEKMRGSTLDKMTSAGRLDAGINGFAHGAQGVSVAVQNPPAIGSHSGQAAYVRAEVRQAVPTFMMRWFDINSVTVSAAAEGKIGAGSGCIYVMHNTIEGAVRIDGTLNSDCGLYANSNHAEKAIWKASGSATATFFSTAGEALGTFNPAPLEHQARVNDPLASLPVPPFPSTHYYNTNVTVSGTHLGPGIYHGGINVAQGVHAIFDPGVYIINGGMLYGKGGPSTWLDGTGVTFYFTRNQPCVNPPANFNCTSATSGHSRFLLDGEGRVTFSAPTSGAAEGILWFQDRTTSGTPFDVQGTNTSELEGIIYIPNADLLFQNHTTNSANYTIIVCKTLRLNGGEVNLRVRADYSELANGSPIKSQGVFTY